MIPYFDEMNSLNFAFLERVFEPEENTLQFEVIEAVLGPYEGTLELGKIKFEGVRSIDILDTSSSYQIHFPSYVSYCVTDECFGKPDDYQRFQGRLFRIYSQSHYQDYISKSTIASDEYPGPLTHYGFICLNHLIDIISHEEPTVTRTDKFSLNQ